MDINDIWIGIIIPLLLTPLSVIAKTLFDNYKQSNIERMKIEFDIKLEKLTYKLEKFYWPIYLNLLNLYQLNYNIPESDDESIMSDNLSENNSLELQNIQLEEDNMQHKKKYKNVCKGYYMLENNQFFHCMKKLPISNNSNICKRCRWEMIKQKVNNKNYDSIKKSNSDVFSVLTDMNKDLDNETSTDTNINTNIKKKYNKKFKNRRRAKSEIVINIPMEFDNISSSSDEEDAFNQYNKLERLNVYIDKNTVSLLKTKLNKYYKDIIDIIEENIHIAEPPPDLTKEIIKFIKYAKIRDVIDDGSITQKYKSSQFGASNNTDKFLHKIEYYLFLYKEEYNNLIKKGPYK